MERFGRYKIDLKNLAPGTYDYRYLLDDAFFAESGGELVRKGRVEASVRVRRSAAAAELLFRLAGTVTVPCDRCLDEMEQPVETEERLSVRFGRDYIDEGDDTVTVPGERGIIDIAWHLYEFVALAVPLRHVHPDGACDEEMESELRLHAARGGGEAERPERDAPEEGTEEYNN